MRMKPNVYKRADLLSQLWYICIHGCSILFCILCTQGRRTSCCPLRTNRPWHIWGWRGSGSKKNTSWRWNGRMNSKKPEDLVQTGECLMFIEVAAFRLESYNAHRTASPWRLTSLMPCLLSVHYGSAWNTNVFLEFRQLVRWCSGQSESGDANDLSLKLTKHWFL